MEYRSSSQAFKFDILTIMQMANIIYKDNKTDVEIISNQTGMGTPKVRELMQYMRFCDMIDNEKLSKFGKVLLTLEILPSMREELLLYKLSRGCVNGGHYYFSRLINQVLYNYAFQINNIVSREQILDKALMCEEEKEFSKDNNQNKEKNYIQALNLGLCDTTTGFGKMGMIALKDGQYEIAGHAPHKLITAYIIYDNWPESRAALKIDEILTMDYFPSKIFFMIQDEFKKQLYELIEDRILYMEKEAGLNQIRLAPNITSEKILDRIVEICQ